MADTQCATGLACWLLRFGKEWKDLIPLFGAGIVAITAIVVAFLATWRLNTAMKQTEFFLKFTERFHNILQAKHQLELRADERDTENRPTLGEPQRVKEAHEIYRQFFGLMFDEFFSYKSGFLDRAAFVEWMRWRHFDYGVNANGVANFAIAGIPYRDGWSNYCDHRPIDPEFQQFLQRIHGIRVDDPDVVGTINTIVLSYAHRSERIFAKVAWFFSEYHIPFKILAVILLIVGYVWLIA